MSRVDISINQRIRINLVNHPSMTEEVTLHFHGLLQKSGYNVMDGPQGVVQRYDQVPASQLVAITDNQQPGHPWSIIHL